MSWLLIVLLVAIVLSPLMWLKQTPRQQQITTLRAQARQAGIQVSLHRRPDAREDETRLESVIYFLPWLKPDQAHEWVLHRFSARGWDAQFPGWRWTLKEASPEWSSSLAPLLLELPEGVTAIVASPRGIGFIWDEKGDQNQIARFADGLRQLQKRAAEISNCA